MIYLVLIPFLGGLFVEALAVLWVHYSERNAQLPLFLTSLGLGTANVLGLGSAIIHWQAALAFILGYGLGPLLGIRIKKWIQSGGGGKP